MYMYAPYQSVHYLHQTGHQKVAKHFVSSPYFIVTKLSPEFSPRPKKLNRQFSPNRSIAGPLSCTDGETCAWLGSRPILRKLLAAFYRIRTENCGKTQIYL